MIGKHGPGDRLAQARRLKAVRDWTDVTRANVARAIGVDPSTITLWESGRLPNEERLAEVAKHLGVSPVWIRYGLGDDPTAGETAGRAGGLEPRIVGPVSEEVKQASAARRAAKKKNATRRGRAS